MADNAVDAGRRRFLAGSTALVGGTGAVLSTWPFITSMSPSAAARDAAAPVEVDISQMELGQKLDLIWRKQPIWVVRRTPAMLAALNDAEIPLRDPESATSEQPEFARNAHRSLRPEFLVLVGVCTHLGCNPSYLPDPAGADLGSHWHGGFFCACHGSRFDLAGRVYDNVPANANLRVPPYRFADDNRIIIGEAPDEGAAA